MLQATGAAGNPVTSVSSSIKDTKGQIKSAASLGTTMANAATSITAATVYDGHFSHTIYESVSVSH